MAGGVEAVYRDHGFPIPFRLVLQLSAKLAPPGIGDGLRQTVVSYQMYYEQPAIDSVILILLHKPVCHLSQRLLHRAWLVAEGFRRGGVAELAV